MKTYRDLQIERQVKLLPTLFKDSGGGVFHVNDRYNKNKIKSLNLPYVLINRKLNLWEEIRDEAITYFEKYNIEWHKDANGEPQKGPEGHLLSSNIACINHLFYLRKNQDLATLVLQNIGNKIDKQIVSAEIIEDGYVAFEIIGNKNYLNEIEHKRGTMSTSIDALMVGKKQNGKNILFFIEWKWTEKYESIDYKPRRYEIYKPLLECNNCPIITDDLKKEKYSSLLYYEPFYQLMRQTLLAWKMVKAQEYNSDEYIHIHIIPEENNLLRETITAPQLRTKGNNMGEVWCKLLKQSSQYKILDPKILFEPLKDNLSLQPFIEYLKKRYW
jgi:hypothetical protein